MEWRKRPTRGEAAAAGEPRTAGSRPRSRQLVYMAPSSSASRSFSRSVDMAAALVVVAGATGLLVGARFRRPAPLELEISRGGAGAVEVGDKIESRRAGSSRNG